MIKVVEFGKDRPCATFERTASRPGDDAVAAAFEQARADDVLKCQASLKAVEVCSR